jgi:hypothetical protein
MEISLLLTLRNGNYIPSQKEQDDTPKFKKAF